MSLALFYLFVCSIFLCLLFPVARSGSFTPACCILSSSAFYSTTLNTVNLIQPTRPADVHEQTQDVIVSVSVSSASDSVDIQLSFTSDSNVYKSPLIISGTVLPLDSSPSLSSSSCSSPQPSSSSSSSSSSSTSSSSSASPSPSFGWSSLKWSSSLTLSHTLLRETPLGTFTLSSVTLIDSVNTTTIITQKTLPLISFSVISSVYYSPPYLHAFELTPESIEILPPLGSFALSSPPPLQPPSSSFSPSPLPALSVSRTFTLTIFDEISGFGSGVLSLFDSARPNLLPRTVNFDARNRVTGDRFNGTYEVTVLLYYPAFTTFFDEVTLAITGNNTVAMEPSVSHTSLFNYLEFPFKFGITGILDTSHQSSRPTPILSNISVQQQRQNTNTTSSQVIIKIALDRNTDIDHITVTILGRPLSPLSASASSSSSSSSLFSPLVFTLPVVSILSSSTSSSFIFPLPFLIPRGLPSTSWSITSIVVVDRTNTPYTYSEQQLLSLSASSAFVTSWQTNCAPDVSGELNEISRMNASEDIASGLSAPALAAIVVAAAVLIALCAVLTCIYFRNKQKPAYTTFA